MDTLYGLSYEARGEKPVPTLIVSINLNDEEKIIEILKKVITRESRESLNSYLGDKDESISFAFENGFGHGKCAILEKTETKFRFVFPLSREKLRETTVTLNTLLFCLPVRVENYYKLVNEGKQLFTLETRYGFDGHYSHAIVGYSSTEFKNWLDDYFQNRPKVKAGYGRFNPEITLLPDSFREAMALSWQKVSGRKPSQMAMDGVGGWIREEQLFTFVCPGNAASAGTYPNEHGKISSHNVWAPEMQLTLLTGLFCLFNFIQKHPNAKSAP